MWHCIRWTFEQTCSIRFIEHALYNTKLMFFFYFFIIILISVHTACELATCKASKFSNCKISCRAFVLTPQCCWMTHCVTYRFTWKLWWQITFNAVKPATAIAQCGDDIIVSAITRQWIKADRQLDFVVPLTDGWCLKEAENTQMTCSIRYIHK